MPTPEQNIALKNGLSVFLSDDPSDYTTPLASPEDAVARGILDETGQATDKGVLFSQLKQYGIFDNRGALTDKGKAYAMPYDEVLDGGERTNWAYQIRSQDGVDKPHIAAAEMPGMILGHLGDAAKGLFRQGKLAFDEAYGTPGPNHEAEASAASTAFVEGAVKANSELLGMLAVLEPRLTSAAFPDAAQQQQMQKDLWLARQQRDKIFNDHAKAQIGETLEDYRIATDSVQQMAKAKEELGDEKFGQITKETGATGTMVDPFIAASMARGVAAAVKAPLVTRAALTAEKTLAEAASIDRQLASMAVAKSEAEAAKLAAEQTAALARKTEAALASRFAATGDQTLKQGADRAAALAAKHEPIAVLAQSKIDEATTQLDQLGARRSAIQIPESSAQRFNQALEIGRKAQGLPVQAIGDATEMAGESLVRLNSGLREVAEQHGMGAAMDLLRPALGAAGFAAGGIPGAAAASTFLNSGGAIAKAGKFVRNIGKEMMRARGQVPFWQRVANYSDTSPLHRSLAHLMDTATLGGAIPDIARRAGAGTLSAYPVDLIFEYLQDDGNPNGDTFKRAMSRSMVLGGSSAALGGMFLGSKARHRQLALGDQRNFINDLRAKGDASQLERFHAIPQGVQRSIATYAAANPNLNWQFKVDGHSRFNRAANTVEINIAGETPLKALVAHEVNHNLLYRNQMEDGVIATLVGDGETGGILRARDGTLDPNFQDFLDAYNQRLKEGGERPVDVREGALEYFVDAASDRMSHMAESGKLGQAAGRTQISRALGNAIDALIPKIPILKDLHMKMGGLLEPGGRHVVGNGLLAEGLREHPEARRLFKQMTARSAGRSEGRFTPLGETQASKRAMRENGGTPLEVHPGDQAMADIQSVSIHQTNPDGTFRLDQHGNRMPIDPATDFARAHIGLEMRRIHDDLLASGYQFAPNEIHILPDGTWSEGHIAKPMLREMDKSGIYNPSQMRHTKLISDTIRDAPGTPLVSINQPTMKKVNKRNIHKARAMTLNETVPLALTVTKDGNLITRMMDVKQLHRNIEQRASSSKGRQLYQGDTGKILNDVQAVMDLHTQGMQQGKTLAEIKSSTDSYFTKEYGPVQAQQHKDFINTISGVMTKSQKDINPSFVTDKVPERGNEQVMRSYRNDRINQVTKRIGETVVKLPFHYESWRLNLFPNGKPTLDSTGRPVARNWGQ